MDIERQHLPLLWAIAVSLFCTPLMMAGVNAILPELGQDLGATATQLALVGTFYSMGLAIFQLVSGSLGDIYGHRRVFMAGALVFAFTGLVLGFTRSIFPFLALRLIQGCAGAMMSACGLCLVASVAHPSRRTQYFALTGAAVYAGIACGPPVAAIVTYLGGWPLLFWLNSLTSLLVFFLMKETVTAEWRPAPGQGFDIKGSCLYALAMGALSLSCSGLFSAIWLKASLFLAFLVLFCLFIFLEKGCEFPVLNLQLLCKKPVFAFSVLAAYANYASFFGLVFYFSIYLQIAKGIGLRETGFILAIQPLSQALSTPLTSRICKWAGEGVACALGAASCGAGLITASFLNLDSSLALLIAAQLLLGFGIGLFSLANTTMIMASAGKENTGQGAALTGAARTAGQLCSMVFITFSLGFFLGSAAIGREALPQFMQSMKFSLLVFALVNCLAIGLALFRNRKIRDGWEN